MGRQESQESKENNDLGTNAITLNVPHFLLFPLAVTAEHGATSYGISLCYQCSFQHIFKTQPLNELL